MDSPVPPTEPSVDDPFAALRADFDRLYQAHLGAPYPTYKERIDRIRRLKAMILERETEYAQAIDADFEGRSRPEFQTTEILVSLLECKHAMSHLKKWMRTRRLPVSWYAQLASGRIVPTPVGVGGIISPWNYPLSLTISPLVGALAAGNRAMIKLSEFTPRFSAVFKAGIERHFSPDEIMVYDGGPDFAQAFCHLPFGHLLFTGSTAVGRHVMRAAAEHLTPVTLELGGKSPVIVGPDYDIAQAAASVAWGKVVYAGQSCVGPDYVLVPRGTEEAFLEGMKAGIARHAPEGWGQMCNILTANHHARLIEIADDARAKGARVEELGPHDTRGPRAFPVTAVLDASLEMRVMQEEVFGPIVSIIPYDSLTDAARFIEQFPRALALYLFTHDRRTIRKFERQSISGQMAINTTMTHFAVSDLPFGGIGESGMGSCHGYASFQAFTHERSVYHQHRLNAAWTLFAPYRGRLYEFIYRAVRRLGT